MPARVIDPERVFALLRSGRTPVQIASEFDVSAAAVYITIKQNPLLSSSVALSQAWIRRPLCAGDWREFVNVEEENDRGKA